MTRLAVIETAEWYENDRITSIKPLFHILTQLECDNPNDFLYSSFVDARSFKSTLEYFVDKSGVRYIYVGSHGTSWGKDRLDTPAGDKIFREQILSRINRRPIRGVFLSSCNSENIARYIAQRVPYSTWIAGYGDEVNWIKACAFEMLFWREVLKQEGKEFGKRKTINRIIGKLENYKCLLENLSFYLWIRQKNDVVDLLA